jgi:hypothetical protein
MILDDERDFTSYVTRKWNTNGVRNNKLNGVLEMK